MSDEQKLQRICEDRERFLWGQKTSYGQKEFSEDECRSFCKEEFKEGARWQAKQLEDKIQRYEIALHLYANEKGSFGDVARAALEQGEGE